MRLGIVGSEAAKFTKLGEERARAAINDLILKYKPTHIVSGHCHLGGIDIWAEEAADSAGITKDIFPPKVKSWDAGYKPRNLAIVRESDCVVCITVRELPASYTGMVFPECYHCRKESNLRRGACAEPHIKSGGCWTAIEALKSNKSAEWIVIDNA